MKRRTVKMTILGFLFLALFGGFVFGSIITRTQSCMAQNNENKYFTNITVMEGDTLWNVAEKYMDDEHYSSIYDYMDELRRMNNLTSDNLYAGQNLVVTYYSVSTANNN